jgi:hypothetical protein
MRMATTTGHCLTQDPMEILINEKNYRVLVFDATFNNISAIS